MIKSLTEGQYIVNYIPTAILIISFSLSSFYMAESSNNFGDFKSLFNNSEKF